MATFEASVKLSGVLEEIFDFLIRPANLRLISPPELGLAFVDPPEFVEVGSRLVFRVQHYGTVQQIVHEIVELERPQRFSETQVRGPLKSWRHDHVFEQPESGGVVVIDRITFEPPGGLVGLLITENKIRETLEDGFAHRHDELRKIWA